MRGRRVAAERGCCDLACGRGTRGGRGGGASVRPLGSGRRWLGARLLCVGWGGGRRWRWAGWAGVACGAAAAPNPRVLVRLAWPQTSYAAGGAAHSRVLTPLTTSARSGIQAGSGGSGSSARTGWPNSEQASLRHSHSCSGPARASLAGWPQVGQRGGVWLMVGLYRARPKQEPRRRGRTASIGTVWCYGDLNIGRVSLPPWGRERGNHWKLGAGGAVFPGANRRRSAA